MVKRIASVILWFFTVAWGWNYVALVSGLPSLLGLVVGAAAGALVWADPLHLLWSAARDAPARQAAASALAPGALEGGI
jgi:hypothetical protein